MTASYHVIADSRLSPHQKIERLQTLADELSASLRHLSSFQKQVLQIQEAKTVDEALDQMEMLLDEAVQFSYLRLYLHNNQGELNLVRELCPQEIQTDWDMVHWACREQELAIIPIESPVQGESLRSVLLLPLHGLGSSIGILILWLTLDPLHFTQEQSTLLTMLAREAAAVLETQRYRQRIEDARTMLADVIESVPHGLLAIDTRGVITMINGTLEIILDVRRADAEGRLLHDALPAQVSGIIDRMLGSDDGEEQELVVDMRGVSATFGLSINPMFKGAGTELFGHVVVFRDLKLSRELAKLRELDSMKNDFLSLVSHELRTPLTSIMAYTETLLMEGMVDTEEERREYLQIIYDEGARLSRLINDVLDLTKLEAGKMDYLFEEQDIHDVVKAALASSNSLIAQKKLQVQTELADDLPPVRLDYDRIMQVLMNLLSNAIKFTAEGGRITVRSHQSPPFEGKNLPSVTVSVVDTGIGIAPQDLNKVFSKFEQVEHIDHHSVGTGLGMPICKQIIEDGHAGVIWIESELGKGTTVSFRIPVA